MKKIILFLFAITLFGSCKKDKTQSVPSIAFVVNSRALGDPDFTIPPPLSSSDGAFTYSSSDPSVATINGSTVSIKNVGTTVITATQASTNDFVGSTVTGTLTVVPTGTYVLGQAVKGGIIYYLYTNASGVHGFMVSDQDVAASLPWSPGPITAANAVTNSYGGGLTNTNNTITAFGTTSGNYAALAAKNYNGGGYTDWYLPCTVELQLIRSRNTIIGGIPATNYWTSNEVAATPATASHIFFGDYGASTVTVGTVTTVTANVWNFSKLATFSVRAVRAF